jgi:hypothetical protein
VALATRWAAFELEIVPGSTNLINAFILEGLTKSVQQLDLACTVLQHNRVVAVHR